MDVSDPRNPQKLGQIPELKGASSVQVSGSTAYVASFDGLNVIDVSDPMNPRITQRFFGSDSPYVVTFVLVQGTRAYIPLGLSSFAVLDISVASEPRIIDYIERSGGRKVDVAGTTAYSASTSILIQDISDLSSPQRLCDIDVLGPEDIAVDNGSLFVGNSDTGVGDAGLKVLDVSDPSNVKEVGWYSIPGLATDVDVANGHIYYANKEGGVHMLRYHQSLGTPQAYLPLISR